MTKSFAFSALAASLMLSGAAIAQQTTSSGTIAGGVTAAGEHGAVAGGVGHATAQDRRGDRQKKRGTRNSQAQVPSSASTSTQGSAYTTRRSGSAAISTQGAATGAGAVSSNSEGEVYSSTTNQGSDADAYGNSSATAQPR